MADVLNWPETDDADVLEALNAYDAEMAIYIHDAILVPRAISIARGAPYWTSVREPEWARLNIEDGKATLSWPDVYTNYDVADVEVERVSFDAALLFQSAEEVSAWKAEQMRLYEEKRAKQASADRASLEVRERQALAALLAKYGRP